MRILIIKKPNRIGIKSELHSIRFIDEKTGKTDLELKNVIRVTPNFEFNNFTSVELVLQNVDIEVETREE